MSELPSVQPNDDIQWGDSGGNELDPGAGQKLSGWLANQLAPSNWWNWLWRRITRGVLFALAISVRKFSRLDGPNGPLSVLAVGDRFSYVPEFRQNVRQVITQKGTLAAAGAVNACATDGENLWFSYVSGASRIIEARDLDSDTVNGTALTLSTSVYTDTATCMDSDGLIVATTMDTTGAGLNLVAHSVSGSEEWAVTVGAGAAYSVAADSSETEEMRVFLLVWNAGSATALYQRSAVSGTSGVLWSIAAEPAWDMCVSPDAIFVIHGASGVANTYAVSALPKDKDGDFDGAATRVILYHGSDDTGHKHVDVGARICTDGVRVYCVVGRPVPLAAGSERGKIFALKADTINHDPLASNAPTQTTPLWSVDDSLANEAMGSNWHERMRICCDDRFVYVIAGEIKIWLDKTDGAVIRRETVSGDSWSHALCESGERVWQGGLKGAVPPYSGVHSYNKGQPPGDYIMVGVDTDGAPSNDPSARRKRRGYQIFGEGRP